MARSQRSGDRAGIDSLPDEEAIVVRYVDQLLRTNRVDDEVFQALLQAHTARWIVELTVWIGRYGALAGILNSFEVSPAAGAEYLPEIPRNASVPATAGSRPLRAAPRLAPITARENVAMRTARPLTRSRRDAATCAGHLPC